MSNSAGFIDEPPPRRRSEAFAPLEVWRRALLAVLLAIVLAGAWFALVQTPMPEAVDARLYGLQLADLDRQANAIRNAGGKPLTIVFLGTSRMRNVALDSTGLAVEAKSAGVARPVASTVLGVNWGGFERFSPALEAIAARKPDVVIIMPELLVEDFIPMTRARMGKAWLENLLWGKEFAPFATEETTRLVCIGFDQSPQERAAEALSFAAPDPQGRGPTLAREFLGRMAAAGSTIIVAQVPVSEHLAAVRPDQPKGRDLLAAVGAGDATLALDGTRFAQSAYCDYAHFDPAHDHLWQGAFFAQTANLLNRLP